MKNKQTTRDLSQEIENVSANYCESPIEERLLLALGRHPAFGMAASKGAIFDLDSLEYWGVPTWVRCLIIPQAPVGPYRADFLILAARRVGATAHRFVVECDGHDYHERTKGQAARDKKRDRTMLALGYQVLRFTGSEIYHGADKCAAEVWSVIGSKCGW